MTTAEIKNNLHKLIVETNDIDILTQIQDYFTKLNSKNYSIPQWQKDEVNDRLENYKTNPNMGLNFDESMDDIENEI